MDFLKVSTRTVNKGGAIEIYPTFKIVKSRDLMIRGGDFYAIWVEELGLWSTDEQDAIRLIDDELTKFKEENAGKFQIPVYVAYLWDASTGMIDSWHKYCQRQLRDNFKMLDEKLIFANTKTTKEDYASKRLPYPLEIGNTPGYETLMSTLYSPEERQKIEWAIGAIVSGESKSIQKFMVLYGPVGTGKSTIINIFQQLFEGYYATFDAKSLGSSNASFALEDFRTNPLVAIQHDSDLSRIEDNTRLNSLVSHELMTVNEKFKSTYTTRFKCFLIIGTNKPVKITDAKSGLLRRLIDVTPTGEKLNYSDYNNAVSKIPFELGAIASHCLEVFKENPHRYDNYIPKNMMGASNDFYNFIEDSYIIFKNEDGTTMKAAWERYKQYCDEARVKYSLSQMVFKEELKNYFKNFDDRYILDGSRVRSYYSGFKWEMFESKSEKNLGGEKIQEKSLSLECTESILDDILKDCQAQYANDDGKPTSKWDSVTTTLSDIDTTKVHFVRLPENHIVIDFDLKGDDGEKSLERNLIEAAKWPETYAEVSKSGNGVHLHYIYNGDPEKLSRVYADHIEIKVFTGKSSLRRVTKLCNDISVATISTGLPLKEVSKTINHDAFTSEKILRTQIKKNLRKEYHAATKPSIDFIDKLLNDAYVSGKPYDVSDMIGSIMNFAANSTNQSEYCLRLVNKMHFKSKHYESGENSEGSYFETNNAKENEDSEIIFFDVEVFPNLFLLCYKTQGKEKEVTSIINPTPRDIEVLLNHRLIGFNNRRYDNHMLYACLIGYNNEQLFNLSNRIINLRDPNAFFGEAYNLSYTDIYDFCSKKQSLKKWEIELGIYHKELGYPWNEPVPEERWYDVALYCKNDVIATEAVFNARIGDFTARKMLAKIAGGTVNDTTNMLTGKLIFGNDKKPQTQFNYRFMGDPVDDDDKAFGIINSDMSYTPIIGDGEYTVFDGKDRPHFPGYKYEFGKSTYRGEEVGEGGYVYAEPGIHLNVALLDIASMHPSSLIAENLFGDIYTKRFSDVKEVRVAIKHHDWEAAKNMLDGALVDDILKLENETADFTPDDLAQALKIAINAVYGLTSAKFDNLFRDKRNVDNIVAKRGALFMINLKHEVQSRGYTVAHIKTDSIKIPNADPEIIQFVMDYGKQYGYIFEHEATYDRMCLVNDAVYIAKYQGGKHDGEWTATGTQFQVPYVFKTLFSHDDITFDDLCETKSVTSALYLDFNESLPEDEHVYQFVGKVGRFCPIQPGHNGALLLAERKDKDGNVKYDSAGGAKGYRWLESSMVEELDKYDAIDRSYYNRLVDKAVETISQYGDAEAFMAD